MGQPSFKPFELLQVVRIEWDRTSQPISVGCEVASIESIHSKMLSGILIAAPMRSIVKSRPAEWVRYSPFRAESVGQSDHCRKIFA